MFIEEDYSMMYFRNDWEVDIFLAESHSFADLLVAMDLLGED